MFGSGTNSAIRVGLNATNTIAVVANGANLDIYVNQQHIDSASDTTTSQDEIGVFAKDQFHPTEVMFSNAKLWIL